MTNAQTIEIRKIQKVLSVIANGNRCFFNYSFYVNNAKLLKEYGTDSNNRTNYILTAKGKMILNTVV